MEYTQTIAVQNVLQSVLDLQDAGYDYTFAYSAGTSTLSISEFDLEHNEKFHQKIYTDEKEGYDALIELSMMLDDKLEKSEIHYTSLDPEDFIEDFNVA
jgi:hypothetical protein